MNIYDIPIALITEQYLDYIELMQELNLDVAGEFLVMAATLIHIKSRTLLPRPDPTQEDGGPEEDPREALVRRLLEHQKYKAAAELLHERETLRSAQFMRPDARVAEAAGDDYEPELEVDLFSLLAAFRGVLERANRRPRDGASRRSRSRSRIGCTQLLGRLSETEACGFEELFADGDGSRPFMIVTFLALLEMIRLKLVRVFQRAASAPIRVYKRARPADAPHPIGDPTSVTMRRRCPMPNARPETRRPMTDDGSAPTPSPPKLKADRRGADLRVAGADHAEDAVQAAADEPKEDVTAAIAGAEGRLREPARACSSSKWPAATRSSRGPSCTSGCGGCSTSGRRRS